jgi:membrane-bound serine protease (ClpP class)
VILAAVLTLVAFALVMVETLIPSFGLLGLLAAGCYGLALVEAFAVESATGWTFVTLGVVLFPLALFLGFRVLPRTPLGRSLILEPPKQAERKSNPIPLDIVGRAVTDLRPAGMAEIKGVRTDVVSAGKFISAGTALRVVAVQGGRVLVEPQEESVS